MMAVETEQRQKRLPYLSVLVRTFYSIQAQRIESYNRIEGIVRDGQLSVDDSKELHEFIDEKLLKQEKDLHKLVKNELDAWPVWDQWFSKVKGIAETLAGAHIAEIRDIARFKNVSNLWAYAGMSAIYYKLRCKGDKPHRLIAAKPKDICPVWKDKERTERCGAMFEPPEKVEAGMRRVAGYRSTWNPQLKVAVWKASNSFLKLTGKSKFNAMYRQYRGHYEANRPDWSKARIHNASLRAVGKMWLSLTWQAWRDIDGIEPSPKPWIIDIGGHSNEIKWQDVLDHSKE